MTSEMRGEDRIIAQRLSGRTQQVSKSSRDAAAIGDKGGFIAPGVSAVFDTHPSEQKALEQALRTACSITIFGIAPRSLVEAMQGIAKEASDDRQTLPWRTITYVTPATNVVFDAWGSSRLGSVVQRWQSASNGIRNFVRQITADAEESIDGSHHLELSFLGVQELYLEVVLLIEDHETNKRRLWTSIGPNFAREDTVFLVLDPGTGLYERLSGIVEHMISGAIPIVTRQLDVSPDGLAEQVAHADQTTVPLLKVRSLQHFGTHVAPPACVPAAITVLRSAAAGEPIVLLKRRSRFTDADDFDKLSLLSGRLLEEDLAGALGVPVFSDCRAAEALDAMWKTHGRPDQIAIPRDAFVRAAQRDIFVSCGLDIAADRLVYKGCQLVEREEPGQFLFFSIFEVVLYRRDEDELLLAERWNEEQLTRINQAELYGAVNRPKLNRLLVHRQDWLERHIFSQPFKVIDEDANGDKSPDTQRSGGTRRYGRTRD